MDDEYDEFDEFDEYFDDIEGEDYYDPTEDREELKRQIKEELQELSENDKVKMFLDLFSDDPENSKDIKKMLQSYILMDEFIYRFVDENLVDEHLTILTKDLDIPFVENEQLPNSLFQGIPHAGRRLMELFYKLTYNDVDDDGVVFKVEKEEEDEDKMLDEFLREAGESPLAALLELNHDGLKSGKRNYGKKLKKCYDKYPDYFIFQMKWYLYLFTEETDPDIKPLIKEKFFRLLSEVKLPITRYESELFYFSYIVACLNPSDMEAFAKLLALERYLMNLTPESVLWQAIEEEFEMIIDSIQVQKANEILKYLKERGYQCIPL
jgi:hypothetical protein